MQIIRPTGQSKTPLFPRNKAVLTKNTQIRSVTQPKPDTAQITPVSVAVARDSKRHDIRLARDDEMLICVALAVCFISINSYNRDSPQLSNVKFGEDVLLEKVLHHI
jgi:hypothetical protein